MSPTASELIFSDQANHNFSQTLGDLKRSTLSIRNRLESIKHDAAFAQQVSEAYRRPLIANERCGSWYIDPEVKEGSAYFKSTDGHTGVWKFSSRRLNLHLLEIIGNNDGCIIVDSTRRGKRMPDALSKTIPIWCAVLNRYLFQNDIGYHELYTPPQVVSKSEHAQILALLPSFFASLKALNIPVSDFRKHITKPLRPVWVTPDSQVEETAAVFEEFHPVICCTVSRRVAGGELSEGGYIQGAGDDTENWAHGLTAPIFWEHKDALISSPEAGLPGLIEELVRAAGDSASSASHCLRCVKPTSCLFVATIPVVDAMTPGASAYTIVFLPTITPQNSWQTSKSKLEIGIGTDKNGSRLLRAALPIIMDFLSGLLSSGASSTPTPQIIAACQTGTEFSIGLALAILCMFFDDNGDLLKEPRNKNVINKAFIRSRMGWISTCMPDANPSRATLQSVNSYLMERPK